MKNIKNIFVVTLVITGALTSSLTWGELIFQESWESAGLNEGEAVGTLYSGWSSNYDGGKLRLWRPGSGAVPSRWDAAEPLSSPADGNTTLYLPSAVNHVVTGNPIEAGKTYTLTAAIGWDNAIVDQGSWALLLYADSNDSGTYGGDTYITQNYATNGTGVVNTPAQGGWVDNSVSFTAETGDAWIGKDLIIVLNQYNSGGTYTGTTYFDNIRLTVIPEPASLFLLLFSSASLLIFRKRRNC